MVKAAQSLVNKSAPEIETIIKPIGNNAPAINLTNPGLSTPTPVIPPETMTDNKPPKAINAPPKIEKMQNFNKGLFTFTKAEAPKFKVVSRG